jgi:hypothetical protein
LGVAISGQRHPSRRAKIPRNKDDDYRESVADARRRFVTQRTGAELDHIAQYLISVDRSGISSEFVSSQTLARLIAGPSSTPSGALHAH